MEENQIKLGATVRQGRKVVKSATITKTQALRLIVEAFQYDVSKAMNCFPTLARGERFKFKLNGYNVTFEPLVNYTEHY